MLETRHTIEIVVPYVHKVDPFVGETRRHLNVFFLHIENKGQEAIDMGWRDVISVRSLDEGLGGEYQSGDMLIR